MDSSDNLEITRMGRLPRVLGRRSSDFDPLTRTDSLFTWEQAVRVLRKRWLTVALFSGLLTTLVAVCAFSVQDVYQPVAQIEIDPPRSGMKTLPEIEDSNEIDNADYLETQAQILQSDALAIGVIRKLKLDRNLELVNGSDLAKFAKTTTASPPAASTSRDGSFLDEQSNLANRSPLESIALDSFRNKLSVNPVRNSRLIEVSFTSHDPLLAQLVTNTLVTQFIDQNYRNRYTSTMQASEWLSTQLDDLRQKVAEANQAVAEYQKKYGFVDAEDPNAPLTQLMGDVNQQLSDAQAYRIEQEAYVRMIDMGQTESVPPIRDDQLYQNLMEHYADSRAQLAQARAIYGDENSTVKKLEDESNEIVSQVDAERVRMVNRIRTTYAAAKAREEMLAGASEKLKTQLGDATSHAVQYRVLRDEATADAQLYNTLQARLKEAGIYAGLGSSNIHIVGLAPKLEKATGPRRNLIIAVGALLSCVFAVLFAFVRESFVNTVRTPDDIQQWVGLHSLSILPRISGNGDGLAAKMRLPLMLMTADARTQGQPQGAWDLKSGIRMAGAEAIRDLRTALLYWRSGPAPQVILVTSSSLGEGKTTVAVNLAVALAQRGRTCLLDCDLRGGAVASAFRLGSNVGLAQLLSGSATLEKSLAGSPDYPNLSVLPTGALPPSPVDSLASDEMKSLMTALRDKFGFLVIDSPPVIHFSDARVLSRMADVVVVVSRYGLTTRRALTRSVELLDEVKAPVAGVVLNDINVASADFHYYNYGYSRRLDESYPYRDLRRSQARSAG